MTTLYPVSWTARWWTPDGGMREDAGTEHLAAEHGAGATRAAAEVVATRLAGARGRAEVQASLEVGDAVHRGRRTVDPVPRAEDAALEGLRNQARGGQRPSHMLDRTPEPLVVMRRVSEAFDLDLASLADVGRWARGALDADALDAALGPRIQRAELLWNMAWLIQTACKRGERPHHFLNHLKGQGAGPLHIAMGLRRAFGMPLQDIKVLLDTLCSPRGTPEEIQRLFDAGLQR